MGEITRREALTTLLGALAGVSLASLSTPSLTLEDIVSAAAKKKSPPIVKTAPAKIDYTHALQNRQMETKMAKPSRPFTIEKPWSKGLMLWQNI